MGGKTGHRGVLEPADIVASVSIGLCVPDWQYELQTQRNACPIYPSRRASRSPAGRVPKAVVDDLLKFVVRRIITAHVKQVFVAQVVVRHPCIVDEKVIGSDECVFDLL